MCKPMSVSSGTRDTWRGDRAVGKTQNNTFSGLSELLRAWLPIAISLLSLGISIFTFLVTYAVPGVSLRIPDIIRVVQGRNAGYSYLYLQPIFVSIGHSSRVEAITGMMLRVERIGSGKPIAFHWTDLARFTWNPATTSMSYDRIGDPAPLPVSPTNPQTPVATFNAPPGWYFTPGTYRMTLIARRALVPWPLQASFTVTLSQATVDFLNQHPHKFLPVSISQPSKQRANGTN
jgi:hypothetical protein